MFITEPSLNQLTASSDDVISLQVSLNRPMVALEDHPTDEGEATICSLRSDSDMVSTYVHLCLYGSATGVFYRYEVDPYPEELRDMVEGEALSFAESLGFIMDDTNFTELDAGERKQYLERGPFAPGTYCSASRFSDTAGEGVPAILDPETPAEAADPGALLETEPDSPRIEEADFTDEDVEDAVRALIGEPQETPDFERAVQEFIGEGEDEEASSAPAPVGEGEKSQVPLSRFQRRPSGADIYTIRGLAPEAAPQVEAPAPQVEAPVPQVEAPVPLPEPVADQPDVQPPEPPPLPAADVLSDAGDSEMRAQRARARYLASF